MKSYPTILVTPSGFFVCVCVCAFKIKNLMWSLMMLFLVYKLFCCLDKQLLLACLLLRRRLWQEGTTEGVGVVVVVVSSFDENFD